MEEAEKRAGRRAGGIMRSEIDILAKIKGKKKPDISLEIFRADPVCAPNYLGPDPDVFYKYVRCRIEKWKNEEKKEQEKPLQVTEEFPLLKKTQAIQLYTGMVCWNKEECATPVLLHVDREFRPTQVPLDTSRVPGASFYTGQIITVKGKNYLGNELAVFEILKNGMMQGSCAVPCVLPESAPESLKEPLSEPLSEPLKGSLSASKSLLQIPSCTQPFTLSAVIVPPGTPTAEAEEILSNIPVSDVSIVMGDVSPEQLKKICSQNTGTLLVIPFETSMHSNLVFPTVARWGPKMEGENQNRNPETLTAKIERALGSYHVIESPSASYIQSPSIIRVNGVSIGITALDVIYGIVTSQNEVQSKERVSQALEQFVGQGSFLPFIPRRTPIEYSSFPSFVFPHALDLIIINTRFNLGNSPQLIRGSHILSLARKQIKTISIQG